MKVEFCTKGNPYTEQRDAPDTKWAHDNVIEIGPQRDNRPAGDIQRFRCRNCGQEWDEELPQ